ncbi:MAG: hypothetical protein ACJ790_21415 [Myxococcaceae bacterium]
MFRRATPQTLINAAAGVVFFIAALNLVVGVLGLVLPNASLRSFAPLGIGMGVLFGVLAVFTLKRSRGALVAAIVIHALDGALSMVDGMPNGGIGALVLRVFLIVAMARGLKAMTELRNARPA